MTHSLGLSCFIVLLAACEDVLRVDVNLLDIEFLSAASDVRGLAMFNSQSVLREATIVQVNDLAGRRTRIHLPCTALAYWASFNINSRVSLDRLPLAALCGSDRANGAALSTAEADIFKL